MCDNLAIFLDLFNRLITKQTVNVWWLFVCRWRCMAWAAVIWDYIQKKITELLITVETYIWQIINLIENCIKYQLQQLSFSHTCFWCLYGINFIQLQKKTDATHKPPRKHVYYMWINLVKKLICHNRSSYFVLMMNK